MFRPACALVLSVAFSLVAHAQNTLTPAEKAAGWELLFDGVSTDAFRGYRKESFPDKGWAVEDGCLRVLKGGGGGDLITKRTYRNFDLRFEFKVAPKANSGILYRVTEEYGAPWQSGLEYQVLEDVGYGVTSTSPHATGSLYALWTTPAGKRLRGPGEFNTGRIRIDGDRVRHWLNGMKVVDARLAGDEWERRVKASKFQEWPNFGREANGHVGLQDHGNDVWYRDLKIRDLDAPLPGEVKLFNGENLSGWMPHLGKDADPSAVFSVEDQLLKVSGRPAGYLRTEADYNSYVLKLDWRFDPVTKKAGNSGVLLRMVGVDKVWPKSVEAQLQSGNAGDFWNIDQFPMQTVSWRLNGRNTKKTHMAENPIGEWNEYEIVVDGGDIILFVNGEEVNRAWDVEVVAGKICLQSEGAPIQFRNIRLAPIP